MASQDPLTDAFGFGSADFAALALTAFLFASILYWPRIQIPAARLASRTFASMTVLAVLCIGLRLILLPFYPVPTPSGADDFGYLLLSDTLAHFRLANPQHPLHQFFETNFVLQEPSYASMYALGQGLVLACGQIVFGSPWAGVLLSVGLLAALCYWMLRAWVAPSWALYGGVVAICQYGPLSRWTNSYWGGAVSAVAGCLVFGALPRLLRERRPRDAAILGTGLAIQLLTRPFESVLLVLCVLIFLGAHLHPSIQWRAFVRPAAIAAGTILPALLVILLHNRAVTHSWTTIPYSLHRYQYGTPVAFTFQHNPVPHRELYFSRFRAYGSEHLPARALQLQHLRRGSISSRISTLNMWLQWLASSCCSPSRALSI